MKAADELEEVIAAANARFASIAENEWNHKPAPEKWSKKEILGHLIDSGQNNLRRFVVTQYEQNDKIVYDQDEWVRSQDYQSADIGDIQQLWFLLNKQLIRTIRHIPDKKLSYGCDTGKGTFQAHTLSFLIDDYLTHLQHHLRQIIG